MLEYWILVYGEYWGRIAYLFWLEEA